MLVLTRTDGQGIIIDENIQLTILEIKKNKVKIGIAAPPGRLIWRQEIYEHIRRAAEEKREQGG